MIVLGCTAIPRVGIAVIVNERRRRALAISARLFRLLFAAFVWPAIGAVAVVTTRAVTRPRGGLSTLALVLVVVRIARLAEQIEYLLHHALLHERLAEKRLGLVRVRFAGGHAVQDSTGGAPASSIQTKLPGPRRCDWTAPLANDSRCDAPKAEQSGEGSAKASVCEIGPVQRLWRQVSGTRGSIHARLVAVNRSL